MEHIVYIFEGYRLDAGRRQLSSSGGVVVPLNSRAMEALLMLVSRAGELVTKRQLLEGVWPGAVVEENNINQCILAIRKCLGESAGTNRFVMTVPGRGYRFVAPVMQQRRESIGSGAAPPPRGERTRRWKLLVVPGSVVALIAAMLALDPGPASPPLRARAEPGDLTMQLRSADPVVAVTQARALVACLRQRPDLHLQVEVHVVGSAAEPPLWTGHYIAGIQDVLPDGDGEDAAGNPCQRLAAR